MKIRLLLLGALLVACGEKSRRQPVTQTPPSLVGTWQLITGTTIENGDTTVTDYTKNRSFRKVINATHFAFLNHDLTKGRGPAPEFSAGGGRYTLRDSTYTEHLDYCSNRAWEGTVFTFTVTLRQDTLTQQGLENVEKAGIHRVNIETYKRLQE